VSEADRFPTDLRYEDANTQLERIVRMSNLSDRIASLSPEKRALLAQKLKQSDARARGRQTISRRAGGEPAALSFAQQRLWFLHQLEPGNPVYNQPKAIRLSGPLHAPLLQQALDQIVARHEVLRTKFVAIDGNPVQVISDIRSLELPVIELRTWPETTREAEAHRLLVETTRRPFDLSRDLMLRALLLRLDDEEHILLLVTHHIASDGWSSGILWRELTALYRAFVSGQPPRLAELPIQYVDYATWQRNWLQGEVLETQLSYWRKQLENFSTLQLPTDRPRPPRQTYRGMVQSVRLSKDLAEALQALSRRQNATLFMTLLAAFQTLLQRYTAQEDILVGTPIAGRSRPEIEGLIGFFVNTLVLRTDLSGNPTFLELLGRVREVALGAYAHQDLPLEKLVEKLHPQRNLSHSPLFQVAFAHQNVPRQDLELPGITVRPTEVAGGTAKFDLTLFTREESDGLRASVEYSTDLFDDTTISRLLGHFETLLRGIVADPQRRLSDLPLLNEVERHRLLVEWNDSQRDFPSDTCIHKLFEAQVKRTPDAVAVVFEGRQLTYGALNCRANQLAHYLVKLGVGPDVLVGLRGERSLEMVVGILGVLKAGGAYAPLDPAYPLDRLAFMLDDSQAPVLLTQSRLSDSLPAPAARTVFLDGDWEIIARETTQNPATDVTAEHLAYVIYTSGSTGRPKGVMIPHRSICNHMFWMQSAFPLSEADRVMQKTPLSFDASVWEFFAPLLFGARLVMARPGEHRDGAYLVKLIAEQQVTVLQAVPSLLQVLLDNDIESCTSLRHVFCGGEALAVDLQERFLARSTAKLHNLYGPTEATIDATYWACQPDTHSPSVAIGRPIANTQVYVLDPRLKPVPVGIPGELHIGGAGLARGYLHRPELTAEKFIANPFSGDPKARLYKTGDLARYRQDGALEYLGRLDHQVKIHGFRIELGEIETVLDQHPAVRQAVVLVREDLPGDKRLVAYLVLNQERSFNHSQLRAYLKQKLPEYMVPSVSVLLETMPLTPNGKLDRSALPAPDQGRPDLAQTLVSPRTPAEETLATIWAKSLTLEQVGIHDNFFDLGGHSLLATQVIGQVQKIFQVDVPLRALFEAPTIASLLVVILQKQSEQGDGQSLADFLSEVESLPSEEVERSLAREAQQR
jgi:amino acid adenylation domain-containing protein